MRHNPDYAMEDEAGVVALLRENPWCTVASYVPGRGLVASHYPVLVDEEAEEFTVFSHVGKPDERLHELGDHELMIVVYGPQGYVSPSWYGDGPKVPTWNFVTAHLYGTPQLVSTEENLALMDRLVSHFELAHDTPALLHGSPENTAYAERIIHGTAAFTMRIDRFEAKLKMSQDKSPEVVQRVVEGLEAPGPYENPVLARYMRGVHGLGESGA